MRIKKIITLTTITITLNLAGGYKIPEQSLNSIALSAAYIAHTTDADTAYFNPANMAFLDTNRNYSQVGVTLAHLPASSFTGVQVLSASQSADASATSKTENIPIPYFHYVAPAMGNWRYGVSVVAPAGLTKRWESPIQKTFAQEFTLQNIEINPVLSYQISEQLSVGGGVRMVYSMGKVYSDGNDAGIAYKRQMEGDTWAFGYNMALAYHPTSDIALGVTYRSNIDLDEEGKANLYLGNVGKQYDATVSVPIPASLNIGISKTWRDTLTLELVYERTFWSSYQSLDFNYNSALPPALEEPFNASKDKSWVDTNTFRVGLTYALNEAFTLMYGYSHDNNPVPDRTLSYELPDSDANIFSTGFNYQYNAQWSWGGALLYSDKKNRNLTLGENENGIVGQFGDGGALLFTLGASYRF